MFPGHHRFEGGADGDLGFAKADVPTDQAIHGSLVFHIGFSGRDRGDLVGGFLIEKGVFKLGLPLGVCGEGEALGDFPFGVHGEEFGGVIEDGFFRAFFCLRPFAIAELREGGISPSDADITRNEKRLIERHIEACIIGESDDDDLFGFAVITGDGVEAFVATDSVL